MNLLAFETSSAVGSVALETAAGVVVRDLGIPRTDIRIAHGRSSRHKVIEIAAEPQSLAARLNAWDRGAEQ